MSKRPKPWKERQSEKHERLSSQANRQTWYAKHWVLIAGAAAVIGFILKDGADAVEKARTLPAKLETLKNGTLSWYYSDSAWDGWWTTDTEYLVDSGDMVVSKVRAQLSLSASQGRVHGEFSSATICAGSPMLGVLMLDGRVSGEKLVGMAYQIIGGKRRNVASFFITRKSDGLTISPLEDPLGLIGERVDLIPTFTAEQRGHESADCSAERMKFLQERLPRLIGPADSNGRRSIQQ